MAPNPLNSMEKVANNDKLVLSLQQQQQQQSDLGDGEGGGRGRMPSSQEGRRTSGESPSSSCGTDSGTDSEQMVRSTSRQHGRKRRLPGYTPPVKSGLRIRRPGASSSAPPEAAEEPGSVRRRARRDLSPSEVVMEAAEQVCHYFGDVAEAAEDMMERLSELPNAVVSKAQSAAHNAADAVKATAHDAADAMKHSAHNAADAVSNAVHTGEELALGLWKACHFEKLPHWMKDNEHLHFGHRPELKSFAECFKSIFRIHTETGNIWTHLIGCVAFVVITIIFYIKPLCATCQLDIELSEKLVFLAFFIGAILCLGCSALFHTLCCHSKYVSSVFSRLDYAGIALLIVGSLIPWLYYGFYCQFYARLTYMVAMSVMGLLTIVLTLWDKFNLPGYRVYRAAVFITLAGIAVVPLGHHLLMEGIYASVLKASMHILVLSGALYLTGAVLYAARIPERFYPGKCDIWFQSHQIFHVLVIAAAFVHYHGISEMAMYRLKMGDNCNQSDLPVDHQADISAVWVSEMGGAVY